jgi:hypothetical protein
MRWLFVLLCVCSTAWANPRLDVAVAAYEAKQFGAARIAFEKLAKHGVPAAHFNLAVMHLRCAT